MRTEFFKGITKARFTKKAEKEKGWSHSKSFYKSSMEGGK